jgi:hypothetical protein
MKVDSDIYCHGRLLLLTQTVTVSLTTLGGGACFIPSDVSSAQRAKHAQTSFEQLTTDKDGSRCALNADGTFALPAYLA